MSVCSHTVSVCSRARQAWGPLPNLLILGSMEVERLPVFSFLVRHPATGYYLHHNYVACLLNDLFGIQARGGCACAGPYALVCVWGGGVILDIHSTVKFDSGAGVIWNMK